MPSSFIICLTFLWFILLSGTMKALHQRGVKCHHWLDLASMEVCLLVFTKPEYKQMCPIMVFNQRTIVKVILFHRGIMSTLWHCVAQPIKQIEAGNTVSISQLAQEKKSWSFTILNTTSGKFCDCCLFINQEVVRSAMKNCVCFLFALFLLNSV